MPLVNSPTAQQHLWLALPFITEAFCKEMAKGCHHDECVDSFWNKGNAPILSDARSVRQELIVSLSSQVFLLSYFLERLLTSRYLTKLCACRKLLERFSLCMIQVHG